MTEKHRQRQGRPASGYQLKFVLPSDLRRRLEESSSASGISIAEDIRRRLEKSFESPGISRSSSLALLRTVRASMRQLEDAIDNEMTAGSGNDG